jgi:hypothetical protein
MESRGREVHGEEGKGENNNEGDFTLMRNSKFLQGASSRFPSLNEKEMQHSGKRS